MHMQGKMETAWAKVKNAKEARTATFDPLNLRARNVWKAKAAVREHVNTNLWNYIQTVLDEAGQST